MVIWAAPMEHSYFNGKLELRNLDDVEDILGVRLSLCCAFFDVMAVCNGDGFAWCLGTSPPITGRPALCARGCEADTVYPLAFLRRRRGNTCGRT